MLFIILLTVSCKGDHFFETHWKTPIPEQGTPPDFFSPLEKNLSPSFCKACHPKQFQGWKSSLHSQTISSGFLWQMPKLESHEIKNCLNCHSPLLESQEYFLKKENRKHLVDARWKSYLEDKEENMGLHCASCHVRGHVRYGPPPRENTKPSAHGGYTVKVEFEDSEFCKSCHESSGSGIQLNGKRLMETFTEWEKSKFSQEGTQCQNCHMPDRNHEWKGIHDREMVLKGIETNFVVGELKDEILVQAKLKSVWIGHKFPTYAIPKVYSRIWLIDKKRTLLDERVIGRIVDNSLTKELLDTRLNPDEELAISLKISKDQKGKEILWEVEVEPDEMYIRVFEESLNQAISDPNNKINIELLKSAILEKKGSRYILFFKQMKI